MAKTGFGLEHVVGIEDEGVAGLAEMDAAHQGIEDVRIDGRPQHPGPIALAPAHGDIEMRIFAKAEENVADEDALGHGLAEPIFPTVVDALELVGTDIGHANAVLIDDLEVEEGFAVQLEHAEDAFQILVVGQAVEGLGQGQIGKLCHPFV